MRSSIAIACLGIIGCGGSGAGAPSETTSHGWTIGLDPPSSLDAAQPVVAFVLAGDANTETPIDPILVEGEPSKVSVGKYVDGETTEVLAERIVPTRVESTPGKIVLRPKNVLALGQQYTIVSRAGQVGTVRVAPVTHLSYLERVWPPRDSVEPTLQTVYCGVTAPTDATSIELFPGGLDAKLEVGLNDDGLGLGSCVRIVPDAPSDQPLQPPVKVGDFALEPSIWTLGATLPVVAPLHCDLPEFEFGPGCISLQDDRALVRAPASTTFWVISSSLGWHTEVVEGGGGFALPNIERLEKGLLTATVFDLAGRSFATTVHVTAPPPAARVVINEVMANPIGPEPAEEWIEVVNDGSVNADMSGWKLRDSGGDVDLPAINLAPSAFVLLVRRDFVGGVDGDVAPAPGAVMVRLDQLGTNGLANAGEALSLIDAKGAVVSAFPAKASTQPGVSMARRNATVLDDALGGFGPHASPGASPGAPNHVE
jgi:hypothetical protein